VSGQFALGIDDRRESARRRERTRCVRIGVVDGD
jgi:hypothetical protein